MFKKTTLAVALSLFAIPAFAQTTDGTVQVTPEGPHEGWGYGNSLALMP